ncbi:MAG: hypothetical protein AMXMBFR83_17550 [Phycisphaerae bacterium]|jgi:protein involved in polysaccharide export with SLBB domain
MNGQGRLWKPVRGNTLRNRWAGLFAGLAAVASGCSEYRMSLAEFMALEEGQLVEARHSQPATRPALTQEERTQIDQAMGPYKVGPGDTLTISISTGEGEASKSDLKVRVDTNGEIRLPKIGPIKVSGLTLVELERRILTTLVEKQLYVDDMQVAVHAVLDDPETISVLVIGAATTPGLVELRRTDRHLLHAVASAGGMSSSATGAVTLKRLRNPGDIETVNLYDPDQLKTALTLAPLENGDIIEVQAAEDNTVFIGGLVTTPGARTYPRGTHITVLQALAAANGLRTDLTPREATLIRRVNGRDYHVKLNLDRITSAQDPNILLAAGDVIWVPHTIETRIQDWFNRNFFLRAGASATYNLNYSMTGQDFLNEAARSQQSGRGGNAQDQIDPFGFLQRNQALQSLTR